MTAQTKTILQGYFDTGDQPTQQHFVNLVDTIGVNGLLVAANDAADAVKGRADYVCDATADDVQIQAAIDALTSGGNVFLSGGSFVLAAGLTVKQSVNLIGVGYNTQIDATGLTSIDAVTANSGSGAPLYGRIEGIRVTLPASTSGDGIVGFPQQSNNLVIRNVFVDGGDSSAWGIRLGGTNLYRVDVASIDGNCNGLLVSNEDNAAINWGNGLITESSVVLSANNTTAFKLEGDTNGVVNMVCIVRGEAQTSGSPTGCIGFHLGDNASRNTLMQCDAENLSEAYHIGDGTGGDATLIDCWAFNCTTSLAKDMAVNVYLNVIGGNEDMIDVYQSHTLKREKRVSVTTDLSLDDTQVGVVMETDGATASTTYTLTLPAASNDFLYRYTIVNTQATVNAIVLAIACGVGDSLIDTDASVPATLTSGGALGDSITVQNINFKYWRVEDKIGTWS